MEPGWLGPYRLDEVIARTPAATVYRAADTGHGDRAVALKVFAPHLCADPAFRERFRHDAAVLGGLRQPHLVPVHSYGVLDGSVYLDMRLVRGPSLATVLRDGPLAPHRARAIADQITTALDAVARCGLGARRIDPSDVLLSSSQGAGEFVQLVGLGPGRPPVDPRSVVSVAELVGGLPEPLPGLERPGPRRRRMPLLIAAVALVALAAAALTAVGTRDGGVPGPPGLVASIDGTGGAVAADTAELSGRPVLVTALADAVRTWDLRTGRSVAPPIPTRALDLATTRIGGRAAVVSRGADELIRVFDLATGRLLADHIRAPEPVLTVWEAGPVLRAMATTEVDGRPVVVTLEPTGASVTHNLPQLALRSHELPGGAPLGPPAIVAGEALRDIVLATVGEAPVAVASTDLGSVRAFDVATGAPVGTPVAPQPARLRAVAVVEREGRPLVAGGGLDNAIRLFDLQTGEPVGAPLTGHTMAPTSLATVGTDDRSLLLSSAYDMEAPGRSEARFWDADTGDAVGPVLVGHPLSRGVVATGRVGDRSVVVATEADGPITIWDVATLVDRGTV
jgi:hypothetical protein